MSTQLQSPDQFPVLCRVCAKHSNKMINLFGIRKKGLMLAEMLAICTQSNIQQTDQLPSNICNQCLANLEIAFDFYNLVKSNEAYFQKQLTAKNEAPESEPIEFCPLNENDIQKHLKVEFNEECAEMVANQKQSDQKRKGHSYGETELWKLINGEQLMGSNKDNDDLYTRKMNRLFECFLCKTKLKSFRDTRVHLKRHDEATPFKCKICSMHFSATQYEQHLCKGQSVQCAYCSESFHTTKSLLEHLEIHKEHKLHKCSGCSKLFPMMYLLECHQINHGSLEKPYVCHICNRGFRVNFLLTKHLTTHSDARRKWD